MRYLWTGPSPNVRVDLQKIYPGCRFSSLAVYQSIVDSIERLKIPGVRYGRQVLHESGRLSPYRAYLSIKREFSEFLICAAPVGESYMISVRRMDHFPKVRWFHCLPILAFLTGAFLLGMRQDGVLGGALAMALAFSFLWSISRYASWSSTSWLSEHLPEIPWIGPLYLRWFRPDTYYRQDVHYAFLSLVDTAIKTVVADLDQVQVARPPTGALLGPIRRDLHSQT